MQTAMLKRICAAAHSHQQIGQARLALNFEALCNRGQTQVGLHQQHPLAVLHQCIGQIDGGGALGLAGHGTGHANDRAALIGHSHHKVRAQQLIRLGSGKAELVADHIPLLCQRHTLDLLVFSAHALPPFFPWP